MKPYQPSYILHSVRNLVKLSIGFCKLSIHSAKCPNKCRRAITIFINGYRSNLMDVVITQKAFGRLSGQKLIKFEPDSVCPSFATTLYYEIALECNILKDCLYLLDCRKTELLDLRHPHHLDDLSLLKNGDFRAGTSLAHQDEC